MLHLRLVARKRGLQLPSPSFHRLATESAVRVDRERQKSINCRVSGNFRPSSRAAPGCRRSPLLGVSERRRAVASGEAPGDPPTAFPLSSRRGRDGPAATVEYLSDLPAGRPAPWIGCRVATASATAGYPGCSGQVLAHRVAGVPRRGGSICPPRQTPPPSFTVRAGAVGAGAVGGVGADGVRQSERAGSGCRNSAAALPAVTS